MRGSACAGRVGSWCVFGRARFGVAGVLRVWVVPCVYGSYSAVYDIVKDDVNGIIIEPQKDEFDAENMAERMSLLMCDNVRLKLMAKAAKQMSNQYSLDVVSDSWYKLFV